MIAVSPAIKADIPAANPISIVIARAGRLPISAKIVSPEGTDSYNVLVKEEPMSNNSGMAMISPSDHFPKLDFGICPPLFSIVQLLLNERQVRYNCRLQ